MVIWGALLNVHAFVYGPSLTHDVFNKNALVSDIKVAGRSDWQQRH